MAIRSRNRVFIRPDEKVKQVGSILLAEEAQTNVEEGTVVYAPEDLDIKEGDKVVYDKQMALSYKDLLVLEEADVWGVIECN